LELFDRKAERLSADLLIGRGADKRTPLAIVSTRVLGDTGRVQAWISQLFVELSRWSMRSPQARLQALIMLDEADLYMPAGTSKPPSKEPLMDLLKRARAGGVGVMLATQTPGDLDYKSRDLITSWFIGKIGDARSVEKVRPLLERKPAMAGKLAQLPAGQFVAVDDTSVVEIQRRPSLLRTDQLPEHEIIALASSRRP
jgi:DNA helicase HerA-like ATPase